MVSRPIVMEIFLMVLMQRGLISEKLVPLAVMSPILGVYLICMAMSWNGVWIIIGKARITVGYFGVAHGTVSQVNAILILEFYEKLVTDEVTPVAAWSFH